MFAHPLLLRVVNTDLCTKVVTTIEAVCKGAGAEVDCPPRNMLAMLGLLSPGGYRLRIAAKSTGWGISHVDCAKEGLTAAGNSVGESEVMNCA